MRVGYQRACLIEFLLSLSRHVMDESSVLRIHLYRKVCMLENPSSGLRVRAEDLLLAILCSHNPDGPIVVVTTAHRQASTERRRSSGKP